MDDDNVAASKSVKRQKKMTKNHLNVDKSIVEIVNDICMLHPYKKECKQSIILVIVQLVKMSNALPNDPKKNGLTGQIAMTNT